MDAKEKELNKGRKLLTNELVKKLQEADPNNEYHVEDSNGAIVDQSVLPGYYDGAGCYVKEDGTFVIDRENPKVRIYSMDFEEAVWDEDNIEIIADKRTQDSYQKRIEEINAKREKSNKKWLYKSLYGILEKYDEGFIVEQPKDKKIGVHNCMKFVKHNTLSERLCQGDCGTIIKSGFFKPVETDSCIRWVLDIGQEKLC